MFSIDAYDLIEQDLIVPFEDIEGVSAEWLDSFYPALMANSRIEGKTWGIPFQRSTIVAYYNKDKFREAGLVPNSRSDEHTSELQSLMRIAYAVFCVKKNNIQITRLHEPIHVIDYVLGILVHPY